MVVSFLLLPCCYFDLSIASRAASSHCPVVWLPPQPYRFVRQATRVECCCPHVALHHPRFVLSVSHHITNACNCATCDRMQPYTTQMQLQFPCRCTYDIVCTMPGASTAVAYEPPPDAVPSHFVNRHYCLARSLPMHDAIPPRALVALQQYHNV